MNSLMRLLVAMCVLAAFAIAPAIGSPDQNVQAQKAALFAGYVDQGGWDASAGPPPSGSPVAKQYWTVTTAGSTSLSGITTWRLGDWVIYTGSAWIRKDGTHPDQIAAQMTALIASSTLQVAVNSSAKANLAGGNAFTGQQTFGGALPFDAPLSASASAPLGSGIVVSDGVVDDTAKYGCWNGAPYHNANKAWSGMCFADELGALSRGIWIGGGDGFGRPDATDIYVAVAPAYNQTDDLGVAFWGFHSNGVFLWEGPTTVVPTNPGWTTANGGFWTMLAGGRPQWTRGDGTIDLLQGTNSATAPSGITVTASPFVYHNTSKFDADVIVSGGVVSDLSFSRNGSTYYTAGILAGVIHLSPGDYLKTTYTGAPIETLVPR